MIIETALEYWKIMQRFHRNRKNPMMPGAAVRDLRRIETQSPAVAKRIQGFTALHHVKTPSGS